LPFKELRILKISNIIGIELPRQCGLLNYLLGAFLSYIFQQLKLNMLGLDFLLLS
jgi:hypothetical protein